MSLNWNTLEGSPARLTVMAEEDKGKDVLTYSMCMALMAVAMPSITKENALEVYGRIAFYERLNGPFITRTREDGTHDNGLKVEDVLAFIGLRTNVTQETEAKWVARIGKNELQSIRYYAKDKLRQVA